METNVGWRAVLSCVAVCCVFPVLVACLSLAFGRDWRADEEPLSWAAYAIDGVFLMDLFSTASVIHLLRGRRLLAAAFAIPLLAATAVLAFFGGLWVSGRYL
jgi:ACR3 family arsenite efflux pump ArsB